MFMYTIRCLECQFRLVISELQLAKEKLNQMKCRKCNKQLSDLLVTFDQLPMEINECSSCAQYAAMYNIDQECGQLYLCIYCFKYQICQCRKCENGLPPSYFKLKQDFWEEI